MSNFGIGSDKEHYRLFLIGPKQEEKNLKEIIFKKIVRPKDIEFLFDKMNSWIACEIKCYSEDDFNCMYQQLKKYIR